MLQEQNHTQVIYIEAKSVTSLAINSIMQIQIVISIKLNLQAHIRTECQHSEIVNENYTFLQLELRNEKYLPKG